MFRAFVYPPRSAYRRHGSAARSQRIDGRPPSKSPFIEVAAPCPAAAAAVPVCAAANSAAALPARPAPPAFAAAVSALGLLEPRLPSWRWPPSPPRVPSSLARAGPAARRWRDCRRSRSRCGRRWRQHNALFCHWAAPAARLLCWTLHTSTRCCDRMTADATADADAIMDAMRMRPRTWLVVVLLVRQTMPPPIGSRSVAAVAAARAAVAGSDVMAHDESAVAAAAAAAAGSADVVDGVAEASARVAA